MNEYITLWELKAYLGQAGEDADNDLLAGFCLAASRQLDRWCHRKFYPRQETRWYSHPRDTQLLKLDDDLLEAVEITTRNGNATLDPADYYLYCGANPNLRPADRIQLRPDATAVWYFSYDTSPLLANAVTGLWGYHEAWATEAWLDSLDSVQDNPLTAGATLVTVADADGMGPDGVMPRFRAGQLVRIEDEYLTVQAAEGGATNKLTVRRGGNGTAAAEHAKDTTIEIYRPMEDVVQAAKELAKHLYMSKDTTERTEVIPETGMLSLPRGVPLTVKMFVDAYRR